MASEHFQVAGRNDGRLYYAVVHGDSKTVIEELRKGDVDLNLCIGVKSFLRHADELGFKQIATLLIEHGTDPDEASGKRKHSLLHHAALYHNFVFASVLLEKLANPSPCSSNDSTPLHIAARTGQSYLARKLLKSGADIDAQDKLGRTPLHFAMLKSETQLAKMLLDANSIPTISDRKGITSRMVAVADCPVKDGR